MKAKCPQCETGKARRLCHRQGNVEVCSECCASIRDEDCGDCVHYASALQHQESRLRSASGIPAGHFMMEVNDEVSDAVSAALEAAQRGRFQYAMDMLTDLLPEHPQHHDVAYGIGVLHALKGGLEESIRWFDKAIAIYPYRIETHYNKAVSHQKLMDIPNCVRSYQRVVEIGPSDDAEVAQARSFIETITSSIKRNQGISLDAYLRSGDKFNQAFELMERSDWRGALVGFRASAAINGRNAPCYGNMGICLGYLGHKAEALVALDRALEIDPDYQPAASNRKLVEQMEEGIPLANTTFQSVNYALDSLREKQQ